jgi:D-alanyl-D-alanine carboxypeptidase
MKLKSALVPVLFFALACACANGSLHPSFSISKEELNRLTESLPGDCRRAIMQAPAEFLGLVQRILAEDEGLLDIVDKVHALPEGFAPQDLVSLDGVKLVTDRRGLELRKDALDALLDMSGEAKGAGVRLVVGSAYRSYAYQEIVYAYWVKTLGQEEADRESAMPGHSQHQLGTVIDFSPIDDSFSGTPACSWLEANAWRFGFSLSYPDGLEKLTGYKYEPWHYRYLGRAAAELIERFFSGLQANFLAFYAEREVSFRKRLIKSPGHERGSER